MEIVATKSPKNKGILLFVSSRVSGGDPLCAISNLATKNAKNHEE
jgi:hypothetical protein